MGYNTTPELIEQNQQLLEMILEKVVKKEVLLLNPTGGSNAHSEQYRLRRVLAACDVHRTVLGGKFAGLGQRVMLKVDHSTGKLQVRPILGVSFESFRPSERDALDFLGEQSGSLTMVTFWPSDGFDRLAFIQAARALGWIVVLSTEEKGAEGQLSFAAERTDSIDLEDDSLFSTVEEDDG
jgi:hypothetical protein